MRFDVSSRKFFADATGAILVLSSYYISVEITTKLVTVFATVSSDEVGRLCNAVGCLWGNVTFPDEDVFWPTLIVICQVAVTGCVVRWVGNISRFRLRSLVLQVKRNLQPTPMLMSFFTGSVLIICLILPSLGDFNAHSVEIL